MSSSGVSLALLSFSCRDLEKKLVASEDSSRSKRGTEPALSSKTVLFWYRWIAEKDGGVIEGNLEQFARSIGISPSVARRAVLEMGELKLLRKNGAPKVGHRYELTETGRVQEPVPLQMPSIAPMVKSMLASRFESKDLGNSGIEKNLASLGITERLLMATLMINADAQGYITGRSIGALSAISGIPKRSIKLYLKGFKQSGLIDYLPGFRGVGRLGACNGLIRVRLEDINSKCVPVKVMTSLMEEVIFSSHRWIDTTSWQGQLPVSLVRRSKVSGGEASERPLIPAMAESMAEILSEFASYSPNVGDGEKRSGTSYNGLLSLHSKYFTELVRIESIRVFNEDAVQAEKEDLPVSEQFMLDKISRVLSRIDSVLPEFRLFEIDMENKESDLSKKENTQIKNDEALVKQVSKLLSDVDGYRCIPGWETLSWSKKCRKLLAALIAWKAIGVSLFIAQYNLKVSDENARIKKGRLIHVLSHLSDGPVFYRLDTK